MSYFKNLAQENKILNAVIILLLGHMKGKQPHGSSLQSWTGRKYESMQHQSDCVSGEFLISSVVNKLPVRGHI